MAFGQDVEWGCLPESEFLDIAASEGNYSFPDNGEGATKLQMESADDANGDSKDEERVSSSTVDHTPSPFEEERIG